MSMFTPLGEGGRRPGPRHRWRRVVAVVLVCALLGSVGAAAFWWWAEQRSTSRQPLTSPGTTPSCTTPSPRQPASLPAPDAVPLEVLNGTTTPGLALETADSFANLGFDVVGFGNAERPLKGGVGTVRYGRGGLGAAVVVASYARGSVPVATQRQTDRVTFTIGPDFEGLATPEEAAAALTDVPLPTPSPRC